MAMADCAAALGGSQEGLSTAEAQQRLEQLGLNRLDLGRGRSSWQILREQFSNAMLILLLTVAALQPCLLALPVLLPACCGLFAGAVRAERALALLRRLVPFAQPYLAVWAVALYTQQLLLLLHEQTGEPL